jgi:uncharacterized protein (DUF1501 family)
VDSNTCHIISRRQFLAGLGATAAVTVAGYSVGIWGRNDASKAVSAPTVGSFGGGGTGTLVVVEMGGGNDALSTAIPHGDPRYYDLRKTLAIEDVIDLDGWLGLHPNLEYIASRWGDGTLAVVEGVGYPEPDLSHFASMATWWSGLPGGLGTGWLGRYLDGTVGTEDPLAGIVIGPGPSPAMSGDASFVVSIRDESGLSPLTPQWIDTPSELLSMWEGFAPAPVDSPPLFAQVASAIEQSIAAAGELNAALEGAIPVGDDSAAGTRRGAGFLADMELAARLVTSSIRPRVVFVHGFGDFDTHQGQVNRHAALLAELDEGVRSFFETIETAGLADEVVLMTTSEFGRRAASNGSGTDHGTAAAHLVIGAPVSGGRYGEAPDLSALDRAGNLVHTVDFRSYYASILDGWLKVDHGDVLGGTFETLGFLNTTSAPVAAIRRTLGLR